MLELSPFFAGLLNRFFVLLTFAVLDVIGAVYLAWKDGSFELEYLPSFLKTFVGYLFAWVSFEAIGFLPGYLNVNIGSEALGLLAEYSGEAVFTLVLVKYVASLLATVQSILGKDIRVLNAIGIKSWRVNPEPGPAYDLIYRNDPEKPEG
jgi:hypothetical protein